MDFLVYRRGALPVVQATVGPTGRAKPLWGLPHRRLGGLRGSVYTLKNELSIRGRLQVYPSQTRAP